jgi:hypothetical protein
MKVLLVHPGSSVSTADVYDGLSYGLRAHGVDVKPYRLDTRIETSGRTLHAMWRHKNRDVLLARIGAALARVPESEGLPDLKPREMARLLADRYPEAWAEASSEYLDLAKPNSADVMYHAGCDALAMALREQVDAVVVVSAMFFHPDVLILMRRAGLLVTVLFTESPYDIEREALVAGMVDGCWTNERSSVAELRAVNPHAGYLPHAWHPMKHTPGMHEGDEAVAAHDVVFVGSGFAERIAWFNAINWEGIDLGLYGAWDKTRLSKALRACVRGDMVNNAVASALYRRAKVGLNLYRTSKGCTTRAVEHVTRAESLSPRAYELAACGVFHLSDHRSEVAEVFGAQVPTFRTPAEAEALIRLWLQDHEGRARVAAQLPACVAAASWVDRASVVLGDITRLVQARRAA